MSRVNGSESVSSWNGEKAAKSGGHGVAQQRKISSSVRCWRDMIGNINIRLTA